jgi:hypothetical protein
MVKTPRTRHSKSTREPVTIDLSPEEVSRLKDEESAAADLSDPVVTPSEEVIAVAETPSEPVSEPEPQSIEEPVTTPTEPDGPFGGEEPTTTSYAPKAAPIVEKRSSGGGLLAGVAGGVIALALAGGLQFAGVLPSGQSASNEQSPQIAELQSQIEALRQQVANAPAAEPDTALAGRVEQAEQQITSLSESVETLRTDLASAAPSEGGGAPVDLGPIEGRIASLETALTSLQEAPAAEPADLTQVNSDISTLRQEIASARETLNGAVARVDTLDENLGALSSRFDDQVSAPSTASIIAVSSLKAALDRGTAFTTELDTFAQLLPNAPQIEGLRAFAEGGVPTRAVLAAEADAAANAMIAAAAPVNPDAGITDKLWASAMGLVQVRPIGMVEGTGVPETVARIDAAIATGDLERALAEYDTLPETAKAAGKSFIDRVRARHDADTLADQALASALKGQN